MYVSQKVDLQQFGRRTSEDKKLKFSAQLQIIKKIKLFCRLRSTREANNHSGTTKC